MAESLWSGLAIAAAVALLALAGYLIARRLARGPRELGTEAERARFTTLHLATRAAEHLRAGLEEGDTVRAALDLGVYLAWRAGRLSDHDVTIGKAIAKVRAGGDLPHATHVSEAHLLDLEREAFLRLTGEPKTLARIAHTLKTGKPLRN